MYEVRETKLVNKKYDEIVEIYCQNMFCNINHEINCKLNYNSIKYIYIMSVILVLYYTINLH